MMAKERIEAVLKAELSHIDQKLREARNLNSAAWIGTALAVGLCLATMADHVPVVITMAAGGALLDLAIRRFFPRNK